MKAGKKVLLIHCGQDGLVHAMEAIAGQLDLKTVQMCIDKYELSSEGSNFGRDASELLAKQALVAVQASPSAATKHTLTYPNRPCLFEITASNPALSLCRRALLPSRSSPPGLGTSLRSRWLSAPLSLSPHA